MIDSPQRSVGSGPEQAGTEVAARLSRLVRDLVWELHPHMQRTVAVTLDSDLDRDLGLDSLGRGLSYSTTEDKWCSGVAAPADFSPRGRAPPSALGARAPIDLHRIGRHWKSSISRCSKACARDPGLGRSHFARPNLPRRGFLSRKQLKSQTLRCSARC
jgi:hypothetical protein